VSRRSVRLSRHGSTLVQDTAWTTTRTPVRTGPGLPIAAAAGRLGLSVEAVRKRARRGSLRAYKRDGQWWVVLPIQATRQDVQDDGQDADQDVQDERHNGVQAGVDTSRPPAGDQSALLEALRQLEKIREENRNLAGQVGYMQAQLLQRDEVIRALQAPAEQPQTAQDAPQSLPALLSL